MPSGLPVQTLSIIFRTSHLPSRPRPGYGSLGSTVWTPLPLPVSAPSSSPSAGPSTQRPTTSSPVCPLLSSCTHWHCCQRGFPMMHCWPRPSPAYTVSAFPRAFRIKLDFSIAGLSFLLTTFGSSFPHNLRVISCPLASVGATPSV